MLPDAVPLSILIADDDADDRMLVEDAFGESSISNPLYFVEDGEQLLSFLRREGRHAALAGVPLPGLILLDWNMPRVDGRTALAEIKKDERFRQIPMAVLTTSEAEENILRTYCLDVNAFIRKPITLEGLAETVKTIGRYSIQIVALPAACSSNAA